MRREILKKLGGKMSDRSRPEPPACSTGSQCTLAPRGDLIPLLVLSTLIHLICHPRKGKLYDEEGMVRVSKSVCIEGY